MDNQSVNDSISSEGSVDSVIPVQNEGANELVTEQNAPSVQGAASVGSEREIPIDELRLRIQVLNESIAKKKSEQQPEPVEDERTQLEREFRQKKREYLQLRNAGLTALDHQYPKSSAANGSTNVRTTANRPSTTAEADDEDSEPEEPVSREKRPMKRSKGKATESREPHKETESTGDMLCKLAEIFAKSNAEPKPRVLKQPLPKFNGDQSKAVLWLKEYQVIAKINKWTDQEKSEYLPTALIDSAKDWYQGTYYQDLPDWATFERQFLDTFIPMGYEERRRREFYSLEQDPGEKPIDYLNKMLVIRAQLEPKPTDREVLQQVKLGLYGDYAKSAIGAKDLTELRQILGQMIVINAKSNEYRAKKQSNRRTGPPPQRQQQSKTQQESQEVQVVYEKRPTREFEPTCYNCGKTKHYARYCPEPKNPNRYLQNYMEVLHSRNPAPGDTKQVEVREFQGKANQRSGWKSKKRAQPYQKRNPKGNQRQPEPIPEQPVEGTSQRPPATGTNNMFKTTQVKRTSSEQNGSSDLHDCPLEKVLFGGRVVQALIDTGGSFSLISMDLVLALKLKIEPKKIKIRGVGSAQVESVGYVKNAEIGYLNLVVEVPLVVVTSLEPQLLLGIDFIKALQLMINFANRPPISRPIRLNQTKRTYKELKSDTEDENGYIKYEPYKIRKMTYEEWMIMQKGQLKPDQSFNHQKKREYLKKVYSRCSREKQVKRGADSSSTEEKSAKAESEEGRSKRQRLNTTLASVVPKDLEQTEVQIIELIKRSRPLANRCEYCGLDHNKTVCTAIHGRSLESKELPAYSENVVRVCLNVAGTGRRIVETHPEAKARQLSVPTGLIRTDTIYVTIVVRNFTPEPIKIERNDKLVSLIEDEGTLIEPQPSPEGMEVRVNSFGESADSQDGSSKKRRTVNYDLKNNRTRQEFKEFLKNFNVGNQLSEQQKLRLGALLKTYRDRFVFKGDSLGRLNIEEHRIDTEGKGPVSKAPYRVSYVERKAIEEQVQAMLDQGVIEPIVSEWASPVVIVSKRDNTLRFCVDYRDLNAITKSDKYPLPRLEDALDILGKSNMYSTLDACSAYWQVKMADDSVEKTTFTCHMGTFCFKYMPFGLKNAPSTMSRIMNKIFQGLNRKICMIYLDDCITMSNGFEDHLENLTALFERMITYDLKLKPSKCYFIQESVSYLGHKISKEGIVPDPERTRTLDQFKTPRCQKDVRAFLGFCGFYRRFIKDFSSIAQPLNKLLKKNTPFIWGDEQRIAFNTLKERVLRPPVLAHYNHEATMILRTDSCGYGIGGHLVQAPSYERRKEGQLLACESRALSPNEQNYSISELECLAVVFCIKKFHAYLYGQKFIVETDHHALCFLMKIKNSNGRLCRWSLVLQGYDFDVKYNAGRNHSDADCLSRYPLDADIRDLDQDYFEDITTEPTVMSFSQVMQSAVEEADALNDEDEEMPDVISVTGIAAEQQKDPKLAHLIRAVKSTKESDIQNHYVLRGEVLYKRTVKDGRARYLLCVPSSKVGAFVAAYHDCDLSTHPGQVRTLEKIKVKYYWRNMRHDVNAYVSSCHLCQAFKNVSKGRAGQYQPLPVPEEIFKDIAMDLIGPLTVTKRKNKYVLSIVCRLAKFGFACPLPNITDEVVMAAFKNQFLLKYKLCSTVLTDRGSNLCSEYSEGFYEKYGIRHLTTTAGHPECNGQVENFNKTVTVSTAICMTQRGVQWDECLDEAVYSYNCTPNSSTHVSPHYLVFGSEPKLLIDRELEYTELSEIPMSREEQITRVIIARQKAIKDIKKSQEKNRLYANQKRRPISFKMGDKVWLEMKSWKVSKGGKLKPRYSGPYVIVRKMSPLTYRLAKAKGSYQSAVVNVKRLKAYKKRANAPEEVEEVEIPTTSRSETEHSEDTDTEVYWEDDPDPTVAPVQEPPRTRRLVRKPRRLRDFVCYRNRRLH